MAEDESISSMEKGLSANDMGMMKPGEVSGAAEVPAREQLPHEEQQKTQEYLDRQLTVLGEILDRRLGRPADADSERTLRDVAASVALNVAEGKPDNPMSRFAIEYLAQKAEDGTPGAETLLQRVEERREMIEHPAELEQLNPNMRALLDISVRMTRHEPSAEMAESIRENLQMIINFITLDHKQLEERFRSVVRAVNTSEATPRVKQEWVESLGERMLQTEEPKIRAQSQKEERGMFAGYGATRYRQYREQLERLRDSAA